MSLYDETWRGNFWSHGGALALAKASYEKASLAGVRKEALIPLASTYYAAGGNARAYLRSTRGRYKLLWAWRMLWCVWRARRLSDKRASYGITTMSADELDVYARILLCQRRWDRAEAVTTEALLRKGLSTDTRALLDISLLEILVHRNSDDVRQWYHILADSADGCKPTTQVRVLRALAEYDVKQGNKEGAGVHAQCARAIAFRAGLDDQITKLAHLP